jgi:hypothetical protein
VDLAARAGWSVRAVVRFELQRELRRGADETVVGDPTDPDAVGKSVNGADAVAVCLGISRRTRSPFAPLVSPPDLTSRSVAAIVQAMERAGVRRIVYVSAFGAGDSGSRIPWWGRAFLRLSQVRHLMADHTRSERLLSGSGLEWTARGPCSWMIRPVTCRPERCSRATRCWPGSRANRSHARSWPCWATRRPMAARCRSYPPRPRAAVRKGAEHDRRPLPVLHVAAALWHQVVRRVLPLT